MCWSGGVYHTPASPVFIIIVVAVVVVLVVAVVAIIAVAVVFITITPPGVNSAVIVDPVVIVICDFSL